MSSNQRHQELLNLLLESGRLSVDTIASHFNISSMTVRRDLRILEGQGLLMRVHGGCTLRSGQVIELPYHEKARQRTQAKEAIARALVARLPDGASLYLDTGTTCATVARLLRGHRRDLRVFSNNLPAVLDLFGSDVIQVLVPGGSLGRHSPDLTGGFGIEVMERLRFDVAVVGADAFDPKRGEFFSADLATAALSRAAQERAAQTFICVDHSKFSKRGVALAGRLSRDSVLFTDASMNPNEKQLLLGLGAELVIVKMDDNNA